MTPFWMCRVVGALRAIAIAVAIALPSAAAAQVMNLENGVAIQGYDPVAYFEVGAATKGDPAIETVWNGAIWRFASEANRDAFLADPERYAPAYGGFCAYGTAHGYLVEIDPEAWAIHDGTLYLNYDRSIRDEWLAKTETFITLANRKWPELMVEATQ